MEYHIANEYFRPPPKCRMPKMAAVTTTLAQLNPKSGINAPRKSNSLHPETYMLLGMIKDKWMTKQINGEARICSGFY